MKIPKNKIILAILLIGVVAVGYAEVNEPELQNLPPVVFINYEGPHAHVNTLEEIRQIGDGLGQLISGRDQVGALGRYFVIHSVSPPDGNKLDADIFGLGVDAGVDHIRNLRVIIQGYLQAAYNYNARDALLLAEFITIYNAVYRGNWDFFVSRYKTPVIRHLTEDKAGLSIRYDEWPGRTLMVIPLTLRGVDIAAIADERVIEELRKEDDMGIPQRQDLVDLIEREAERTGQQAQEERQVIREEERRIADERQQIQEERQTADERQQRELDEREQELVVREEELEQRREEVERLEEYAEQIHDEAQQQRQEIADDMQNVIVQETTGGVLGITLERREAVSMGRIIRLNPVNGVELRRSPMDVVHIRTVNFIGGRIIAIAGEAIGQGAVRLVEISPNTLEMVRQGDDDIRMGSHLWTNGNDLYAIIAEGNNSYLGRFNTDLVLQARSSVLIHSDAAVAIQQGRLLTQHPDGSVLALNPADLTEIRF